MVFAAPCFVLAGLALAAGADSELHNLKRRVARLDQDHGPR